MIKIRSKVDGFRRGGMAHSSEWTEHKDHTFTPTQLLSILDEPMLQVDIPGHDMSKVREQVMTLIQEGSGDSWGPGSPESLEDMENEISKDLPDAEAASGKRAKK